MVLQLEQSLARRLLVLGLTLCTALPPLQALSVVGDVDLETDQVSLLQAELILKAAKSEPEVDVLPAAKATACAAAWGDSCGCAESGEKQLLSLAETSDEPAPTTAVAAGGAGETAAAARDKSWLAFLLKVLVGLIFLDGLRRWREQAEALEAAEAAWKADAEAPSFELLLRAVLDCDTGRCEDLLSSMPSVAGADLWGCTVVHAAAREGLTPIVAKLLERGGSVHEVDAWDETPLHVAARGGHTQVCDLLLACGANIDAPNAQEWTALVVAADAGQEAVCELLLSRGAGFGGLDEAELPQMLAKMVSKAAEFEVPMEYGFDVDEPAFWETHA